MAPPLPRGSRSLKGTKNPTHSTVRIASRSLNQTFRGIPASWCTGSEDGPVANATTESPEALSARLESLDGLPPLHDILPRPSLMPVPLEDSRPRITIKRPTKPPSKIILRTQKSNPATTSREPMETTKVKAQWTGKLTITDLTTVTDVPLVRGISAPEPSTPTRPPMARWAGTDIPLNHHLIFSN